VVRFLARANQIKGKGMVKKYEAAYELTPWQQQIKQNRIPRPPDRYCDSAKRQFQIIVDKILFIPNDAGALEVNMKNLGVLECFAIGEGIFDPDNVRRELHDVWESFTLAHPEIDGVFKVRKQPTGIYPLEVEKQTRERLREYVLVHLHNEQFASRGEKFPAGRREGALSPIHKHLAKLYGQKKPNSFFEFWKIIGQETERYDKPTNIPVILLEIVDSTLSYQCGSSEKSIEKRTIENNMSRYKKICG
jgi:hypothetical protein